jgi:type I restriction enzyme S subunit
MSFPRYPAYKDSGVMWLGEVPEHWEVKKLKNIAFFAGGGTPSRDNLYFWGGPIPWVSPKDMKAEKITQAEEGITQEGLDGSPSSLIAPGHVLLVVRSGILRHTIPVAINAVEVALNQDMKAIRLNDEICSCSFLLRWIQGFNDQLLLEWGKQGATVESIEQDYLSRTLVPLPPLTEQHAITTFLDRETAKIDALIAEQQHLIQLLQEKRQAVISHAVTKGLNPDAPMKDSGVEWLGEVPEHWALKRLKQLSPNLTVGIVVNPSEYVSDEGLPFIYGGDIREGMIDWENSRRIAPALSDKQHKTRLRSGDLLMVRVGAPGITAVVPTECEGGNCASVMLIRQGSFSSQWLCFVLNTRIVRFQVEVVQYGAAQEQFNISHAANFWVPVPPLEEQDRIAALLVSEDEKAQGLILQAHLAVALLQERRTALISAAVTGQIDVRGLVPDAGAA